LSKFLWHSFLTYLSTICWCFFCRLEGVFCCSLIQDRRPVISDAQHGFAKGHSTVSNLVQFSNGVINEIEDGWQVDSEYTDFSKAFDTVCCSTCHVYLVVHFCVEWGQVKHDKSNWGTIYPKQYSSFWILPRHLTCLKMWVCWADDLKLFMTIKCIGDCQLFQKDLNRLDEWCRSNRFDLNARKCKSMSFRRNATHWSVYSIDGTTLKRVMRPQTLEWLYGQQDEVIVFKNVGFY
jgi:hypothetical protein